MRSIIQFSASVFIVIGALVFGLAFAMVYFMFKTPVGGDPAVLATFVVAIVGVMFGASIVLIGGAAYLLASIDKRLEDASWRLRALAPAPPTEAKTLSADATS